MECEIEVEGKVVCVHVSEYCKECMQGIEV